MLYSMAKTFYRRLTRNVHPFWWWTPGIALLLVPLVFWNGLSGKNSLVGGDVPSLIFLYPEKFLSHTAFTLVGGNLSGINSSIQWTGIALLALLVHLANLNAQGIINGLTLSLTYFGVARLILVVKDDTSKGFHLAGVAGGVTACLAPMIAQSFWVNNLPRLYLTAFAPWLMVLLIRYVKTGMNRYIFGASCAIFFAAPAIADIPGSLPVALLILLLIPILTLSTCFSWQGLRRIVAFFSLSTLLNSIWLIPLSATYFLATYQVASATSTSGKVTAVSLINSLAPLQSLSDSLSLRFSEPMAASFGWVQLPLELELQKFSILSYVPVLIIAVAAIMSLVSRTASKQLRIRFTMLFAISTMMLSLQSLSLIPGVKTAFKYLTFNVPGWTSQRNFWETFAIPLVLAVSLTLGFAVMLLAESQFRKLMLLIPTIGIIIETFYGFPLLKGDYFNLPYYSGASPNRVVNGLPTAYQQLLRKIPSKQSSPILSLPIQAPAYSLLTGSTSKKRYETYIGVSPAFFEYHMSDYNGIAAFGTSNLGGLQQNISNDLRNNNVVHLAQVIRLLGIAWIIDNRTFPMRTYEKTSPFPSYSDALTFSEKLLSQLDAIPVESIANYTLYRVQASMRIPFISVDKSTPFMRDKYGILKLADGLYPGPLGTSCPGAKVITSGSSYGFKLKLHLSTEIASDCYVIVRNSYSQLWSSSLLSDGRSKDLLPHIRAYGFANAFELPALHKGNWTIEVNYKAQRYVTIGIWVTAIGWMLSLGSAGHQRVKHLRASKRWTRL